MKNREKKLELPFHVIKRSALPLWKSKLFRVIAVLAAVLLCSILAIFMIDADPLRFIGTMFDGAFGTWARVWVFAKDTAMLLCIALAITPAFKMRFWNIGAEGQTLIGALAAVAVVIYCKGLPEWLLIVVMLIAAVLVGAIWGGLPALFKAFWGTNETLVTLMMNYVASGLVAYFLLLWTPSGSSVLGRLDRGHLPVIGHENLLVILLVLVLTALIYVYQKHTKHGYEINVVGDSMGTANYAGMKTKWIVLRTVFLSACLIGLAASFKVGTAGVLSTSITDDVGWTGIIVAWLAQLSTPAIFVVSALINVLQYGSSVAATTFKQVDSSYANMLQGAILFLVLAADFFIRFRIVRNRKGGK